MTGSGDIAAIPVKVGAEAPLRRETEEEKKKRLKKQIETVKSFGIFVSEAHNNSTSTWSGEAGEVKINFIEVSKKVAIELEKQDYMTSFDSPEEVSSGKLGSYKPSKFKVPSEDNLESFIKDSLYFRVDTTRKLIFGMVNTNLVNDKNIIKSLLYRLYK